MLLPFLKAGVPALLATLALLALAVACATAAPPTAAPTNTPVPTVTPTPTTTPTPTPNVGNWTQEEFTDATNGNRFLTIQLNASASSLDFPYNEPYLSVGCINSSNGNSRISMLISWDDAYIGSDDPLVDWRADGEIARRSRWMKTSEDGVGKLIHGQEVNGLLQAEKITVQLERDFTEPITAVWHPAGFAEAYKPVAAACGQ